MPSGKYVVRVDAGKLAESRMVTLLK